MDMTEQQELPHDLKLEGREKLTLSGITEVISFDDTAVQMHTPLGRLTVLGQQLQLRSLTPESGNVTIRGQIDALSYEQTGNTGGWLSRFFQ